MYVKRLELQGFKSFKDKTVIHFDDGITGIVGPNGCGKSNVVDAMFWVMGEMSSKHLRGTSMSDLIFSGSDKYPEGQHAEVTMVLQMPDEDESTHHPLAKMGEVALTRKLYRSGDSEYQINRLPCRLRDIQEFFMDTGVGPKAYSIIAQGEIDRITTQKPEDRRTLIEEVAGISKYKKRKKESLRKMESTQANLMRVNDIMSEIEKRLKSLDRQAKKAKQYRDMKVELKERELRFSAHRVFELLKDLDRGRTEVNDGRIQEAELDTFLQKTDVDIEQKKISQTELSQKVDEKQEEVVQYSQKVTQLESKLDYRQKTFEDLKEKKTNMQEEASDLDTRLSELGSERQEEQKVLDELSQSDSSVESRIQDLEKTTREGKAELSEKESHLEEVKSRLMSMVEELSTLQSSFQHFSDKVGSLETSEEEAKEELSSYKSEQDRLQGLISDLERKTQGLSQKRSSLQEEVSSLQDSLEAKRRELETLRTESRETERSFSKVSSQVETLEEYHEKMEGLEEGPRAALQFDKEQGRRWFQGLLVDHIQVQPGYEAAVEAVLGPYLQAIGANSDAAIQEGIEKLKEEGWGRGHFFAADLVPSRKLSEADSGSTGLDWLHQKVQIDGDFKDIAQWWLEDVAVVYDLKEAFELKKKHPKLQVVTKSGDVIRPEGLVVGGSQKILEAGMVAKKKQLEEFKEEMSSLQKGLQDQKDRIESLNQEVNATEHTLNQKKEEASEAEIELQVSTQDLQSKKGELSRCEYNIEQAEKRAASFVEKINSLKNRNNADEKRFEEKKLERQKLDSEVQSLAEEIRSIREKATDESEILTKLKIQEASRKERITSAKKRLEEIDRTVSTFEERLQEIRQWLDDSEDQERELQEEIDRTKDSLHEELRHLKAKREELSEVRSEFDAITSAVDELYQSSREKRKELEAVRSNLQDWALKLEKFSNEEDHLSRNVFEKYFIDLRKEISAWVDFEVTPIQELIEQEKRQKQAEAQTYQNHIDDNEQSELDGFENSDESSDEDLGGENERIELEQYEFDPHESFDKNEDERRIEVLKDRMRKLGDVNTSAIEEYEKQSVRYDFLTQQKNDLMKSLADLEEAIERINETSIERFKKAYDSVNDKLKKVFPIIFGGGQAKLSLTDPDNLLETGVEILAQPPGKKNQSIALLSGGEKAMTAISLIFSIFLIKPSPFCLLDEVDAPLDDANIGRYNDLLREMSARSQFIIVTHNKRTMELNDRLYGVTMEEPGISKVVGVELNA